MGEGTARFWSTVFAGFTAISLVLAGVYTLWQYISAKETDRQNIMLQMATATLAAKQSFNSQHLGLCAQAAGDAGTLATSKDKTNRSAAEDDFWRLYWGPLGIVEQTAVANAMVAFGNCLKGQCGNDSQETLALNLAHACRAEVSTDFDLHLTRVPERPGTGGPERRGSQ
jgi:hypothetical protein